MSDSLPTLIAQLSLLCAVEDEVRANALCGYQMDGVPSLDEENANRRAAIVNLQARIAALTPPPPRPTGQDAIPPD